MDEIDALRALGSDVPPPDASAKRNARAALLAHAEANADRPRQTGLDRWRLHPWRLVPAVTALSLIALIWSGVLPLGRGPDPAAAAALNHAADVAAAQSSEPGVRHTKSEGAHLSGVDGGSDRPGGVWALVPVEREMWIAPDGSGRIIERPGEMDTVMHHLTFYMNSYIKLSEVKLMIKIMTEKDHKTGFWTNL